MQSAHRIAFMSLALAAVALAAMNLVNRSAGSASNLSHVALEPDCVDIGRYTRLGPARTVAEVESASLTEMQKVTGTPLVPFGHSNDQWIALKQMIRAGDELREFETDTTGGYALVRGRCVVGQIVDWIR